MSDLVSIVIPAYNRANTLTACVRSVQAQTYHDWEIVIADDGSKDNTAEIAGQLARDDKRVRVVRHDRNRGAQAARNSGIRAAQGDWIAFLDSDDQWLPDSLQMRLELVRKENRQVVHSECYILRDGQPRELFGTRSLQGWIYRELLTRPGPTFPSLLVARKALEKIGWLDEAIKSYQEWDTCIRLSKQHEFSYLPEPTYVYDCRGQDMISKNPRREGAGYEQVFRKHTWAILRQLGPKAMARHFRFAASRYEVAGCEADVARCYRLAFVWWPFRPGTILKYLRDLLPA